MVRVLTPGSGNSTEFRSRAKVCALAVMAKAPRPGAVKTRLSPPLTAEQAAKLNVCFLRDTTENIASFAVGMQGLDRRAAGMVAYTPVGDEAFFEGMLPDGFVLVAQRGDRFGERLLAAAQDILACGYGSVCLIDSDSPTLPQAVYELAVSELARAGDRIVLGPTADGGYYLIGMKQAHAAVFERIHWSTETVSTETRERANAAGIQVVDLPLWYDVDDASTLDILKVELLGGMAPGFATQPGYAAACTRDFLLALDSALIAATAAKAPDATAADERAEESWEGAH